MKIYYLMLLLNASIALSSDFVISKKDREEKKIAKLSFAKLKEELACRSDMTIKSALHAIELLAHYQKMVTQQAGKSTIFNGIADCNSTLADLILQLVKGVGDLALDEKQTNFGKAGKKELIIYCDHCAELNLLLETLCAELEQCMKSTTDEIKKQFSLMSSKLLSWQQQIKQKAATLS